MREPESVHSATDEGNGHRPVLGYMFPGQAAYGPVPRTPIAAKPRLTRAVTRPPIAAGVSELLTSITGVGLAGFMLMHLGLLSSVLLGRQTMDSLAAFLERYYLLHFGAVVLLVLAAGHIILALRKVPVTFRQQQLLLREMSWLRHLDTWTWAFQVVTAVLIIVMGSIHLWVILSNLPIESTKSGERVFQTYWWFYAIFILVVEGHLSMGLYRVAVKWGLIPRSWAHRVLNVWTLISLVLGFAILVTFYRLGGNL